MRDWRNIGLRMSYSRRMGLFMENDSCGLRRRVVG